MDKIAVKIQNNKVGELFYEAANQCYGFNYTSDTAPVSLVMPYKASTYLWNNRLHPVFDMNMPEGYLFEILKNYLNKQHGYINDFLLFSYLCPNIHGRLSFSSEFTANNVDALDLDEILHNDSEDTFVRLVQLFLSKNAISGVQPKTLALLQDKESLTTKEYIIKTWGAEYPHLAENEYFCLKAVEKAGVEIPIIFLSENKQFLVVERFNLDKSNDSYLGFEEVLGLLGKNKEQKYEGSYEQVATVFYRVVANKRRDMASFYKTLVMSYLLKNGNAHLKNFGVLYDSDMSKIRFSPAYDIVNTAVYVPSDRPALTLFGKKVWFSRRELIKFGVDCCYISEKMANAFYDDCVRAVESAIVDLQDYIQQNPGFSEIGLRMIDTWNLSLNNETHKEVPIEIRRNWAKNKSNATG
ncbi:MAG: type II toxin-antitoxin system HipA family toxin [Gammaproteobacteria bacterium]|nr:type II toxin-antitoxin system HipA family toxin [Gammaproteobacteria bacterium]